MSRAGWFVVGAAVARELIFREVDRTLDHLFTMPYGVTDYHISRIGNALIRSPRPPRN